MARVLVLYSTTDGHTAKIAEAIGNTLRRHQCHVDIAEAGKSSRRAEHYSAVLVAAPVRGGRYPRSVKGWIGDNSAAMRTRPTAFVSVCLAIRDRRATAQRDLNAALERFLIETGWRPVMAKPVAGALLYSRYNWLVRLMMKHIVGRAGGDTDTSRDYEYTDWADLRSFVVDFIARIRIENGSRHQNVA